MSTTLQDSFLRQASAAARAAGHIFPDYAACEAALESTWGQSRLAREANNLFGQKQSGAALSETQTLSLPTQEFLHGRWVTVTAHWVRFTDQAACFRARMALLARLQHSYPAYGRALVAASGEVFVEEVSRAWSTDPQRAAKVLAIHRQHCSSFVPQPFAPVPATPQANILRTA
jgi:flagellum-specific peptidoglycan hydrolase FlgJ